LSTHTEDRLFSKRSLPWTELYWMELAW